VSTRVNGGRRAAKAGPPAPRPRASVGEVPDLDGRRRAIARATLGGLGLSQAATGAWAILAPGSFYGDFPFGRGWVELLPAYNQHLTTDVGALYLAMSAVLLGAAWAMERTTVIIACIAWLAFAIPHTVYHGFHLEPFGTGDAIASSFALAATLLAPAWVLFAVLRPRQARPARAPGGLRPADDAARLAGVTEDSRS
jgi:hypothetical protein